MKYEVRIKEWEKRNWKTVASFETFSDKKIQKEGLTTSSLFATIDK